MTTQLGLPEISFSQAQKFLTHNEALHHVDMWLRGVKSRTLDTPPGAPVEGDAYIMPPSPQGDWSALAVDSIALWFNGVWEPIPGAVVGPEIYVEDEDVYIAWTGTEYRAVASAFGGNAQTADYTLVVSDTNKIVSMDVAIANTLTIPAFATEKFNINSMCAVWQKGAGVTSVVGDVGVTVLGAFPAGGFAWLIHVALDTWVIK